MAKKDKKEEVALEEAVEEVAEEKAAPKKATGFVVDESQRN